MQPKNFGRTTVQGATFSMRGQLYYGHVNAIAANVWAQRNTSTNL